MRCFGWLVVGMIVATGAACRTPVNPERAQSEAQAKPAPTQYSVEDFYKNVSYSARRGHPTGRNCWYRRTSRASGTRTRCRWQAASCAAHAVHDELEFCHLVLSRPTSGFCIRATRAATSSRTSTSGTPTGRSRTSRRVRSSRRTFRLGRETTSRSLCPPTSVTSATSTSTRCPPRATRGRCSIGTPTGFNLGPISRDKRYIALVKPNTTSDADIFLHDRQTATTKNITAHTGTVNNSPGRLLTRRLEAALRVGRGREFIVAAQLRPSRRAPKAAVYEQPWDVAGRRATPRRGKYLTVYVNEDSRYSARLLDAATPAAGAAHRTCRQASCAA